MRPPEDAALHLRNGLWVKRKEAIILENSFHDPTVWLFTDVYFTINCYLNSKNSLEQNIDNWGTIKHSTQSSDEGRDFMKQQSKAVHVSMRQNNVT